MNLEATLSAPVFPVARPESKSVVKPAQEKVVAPPMVEPLPKLNPAEIVVPQMERGADEPFFALADAEDVLRQKKEFRSEFLESIGGEEAMAQVRTELAQLDPQSRAAQLMRDQLAFDQRILESTDQAIAAQEYSVEGLQIMVDALRKERRERGMVRMRTNQVLDQRQLRVNREARRAAETAALRDNQDTVEAGVILDKAA